jgi:flavin-dependent dehydrogenase
MKISIIGAGLAGLSCAHELEKHGLRPVVYERNSYIGDQINHVAILLEIFNRPIRNIFKYIEKEYGIRLKPLDTLTKLTHFSPNKTTIIKGNFGHFTKRNNESDSLAGQIYSQLKNTELRLNQSPDLEKLASDSDYVIVANGNPIYSETLGCWQNWLDTYLRGAVILGDFDPHEMKMWINKDYCKRGYAYLTPFSEKKASIVLITSDVNEKEIDHFWDLFLYTENLKYTITEEFKLEHKSGFVYPLKYGNVLFAGNAGGAIEPFLGFGQFSSITHGVMAARSIVFNQDYEKLVGRITQKNFNMLQLRKVYDMLDNNGYDLLLKSIGLPGIKHVAYYTNLNVLKLLSAVLKLIPASKRNI